MNGASLVPLLPVLVVAASAVVLLLGIALRRSHAATMAITLGGLACACLSIPVAASFPLKQRWLTPLLIMDGYAYFFAGLIIMAAFAVAVLSREYLNRHSRRREEYYVLLLVAVLGSLVLSAATHFVSFFLGMETLSIPLYALIAYLRSKDEHVEAGVKYLILSAVSTSFLLFGMALIYARLGTMEFSRITELMVSYPSDAVVLAGTAMLMTGVGFKLAVVPFHMWTPDVYQGAPAPVAAFIATASKGAVFALMLRYFSDTNIREQGSLFLVFSVIAVFSMFAGNILALFQTNVKRILAYSSIAHFGYLLVAFLSVGTLRVVSVMFYLVQYFITTIAAFGVVTVMSRERCDVDGLDDYQGLFFYRPWLAVVFSVSLLSLAGIPLTAGFMAKFLVITAGLGAVLPFLVIAVVVNSVIGLFYYLRALTPMFTRPETSGEGREFRFPLASCLVICALAVLVAWWGIFPSSLVNLILSMTEGV